MRPARYGWGRYPPRAGWPAGCPGCCSSSATRRPTVAGAGSSCAGTPTAGGPSTTGRVPAWAPGATWPHAATGSRTGTCGPAAPSPAEVAPGRAELGGLPRRPPRSVGDVREDAYPPRSRRALAAHRPTRPTAPCAPARRPGRPAWLRTPGTWPSPAPHAAETRRRTAPGPVYTEDLDPPEAWPSSQPPSTPSCPCRRRWHHATASEIPSRLPPLLIARSLRPVEIARDARYKARWTAVEVQSGIFWRYQSRAPRGPDPAASLRLGSDRPRPGHDQQ